MKLREIAAQLGGGVVGNPEAVVERPGRIDSARPGEITFLANPKYQEHLATTKATAVIVSKKLDLGGLARPGRSFVVVDDPYVAFGMCLAIFDTAPAPFPKGIHPTAVIAESAKLGKDVSVGARAVVGERTKVGARTTIQPGAVIAADVEIGEDCVLEPNVTVRHGSKVGNRVVLRAGCVIGAEGFGFAKGKDGRYMHIPQIGIVVLEDGVDVGSNATIARATAGETRIGRGTILDCLVHIAHNCEVGENTAFAAQVGVAGSAKIGADCSIGGQVGIAGHVKIADRVVAFAQSGLREVDKPGTELWGSPAVEKREAMRRHAALERLPGLLKEFRELRAELERVRALVERK
jgi:UDP-3-O-[3-hydroxymyristoyl] glucosamine N-acyltransferase